MANMVSSEETNLTHLNVDCLERICRFLELKDLMNLADASKQLRRAADLVFLLEYSRKYTVKMGYFARSNNNCELGFMKFRSTKRNIGDGHFIKYEIEPTKPKEVYQLLRCFGHLIFDLKIKMNENSMHFERTMFYVNEYCAKTLTELTITERPYGSIVHFVKPFANIHTLCVRSCDLENVSMTEIFPNIKCLTYHCGAISEFARIQSDVSNLEHLELIPEHWDTTQKETLQMIRLNPKIRSLGVPMYAIYPGLNDILPNLQLLRVNQMTAKVDKSVKFLFPTVKRFEIIHFDHIHRLEGLPFSFDKLEEFTFEFSKEACFSQRKFHKFLSKHPSIVKLKIYCLEYCCFKATNLVKFGEMWPLVEELHKNKYCSIDDFVYFYETKSLKKFILRLKKSDFDIPDMFCTETIKR